MPRLNTLLKRFTKGAVLKPSQRVSPYLESLENRTLLSHGLHILTNQHTDLDVTYSAADGQLHLAENNKDKDPIKYYRNPTKHVILDFLPGAEKPQTADPRFAFTGAAPGDPVWIVPISPRDPNLLQLGVSAERIGSGTLGAYNETDPRINNVIPFPWIRINLVAVRGPGYFSVWQDDEFGNPTVWISTFNNPNPNLFFTFPGGHVDYNWAFTAPGNYQVDFQASAYLPDFTPVYSTVVTYHFQVDPAPTSSGQQPAANVQTAIALPQITGSGQFSSPVAAVPSAAVSQAANPPLTARAPAQLDQVFASATASDQPLSLPVPLTPVSSIAWQSDLVQDITLS
jgi:surface-anchored protein